MAWAQVAAAAISAIGGYIASRQAAKGSAAQRGIEGTLSDNLKQSAPIGMDMLRGAQYGYNRSLPFFSSLASGDRSTLMGTLAPQLQSQNNQYRSMFQNSMQKFGRNGGGAEQRLGMQDTLLQNRGNMMFQGRLAGASELANLSGNMGSLGNSVLGGGSSTGLGLLGSILNRNQVAYQQGRDTGNSIGSILQMFLNAKGSGNGDYNNGMTIGTGTGQLVNGILGGRS